MRDGHTQNRRTPPVSGGVPRMAQGAASPPSSPQGELAAHPNSRFSDTRRTRPACRPAKPNFGVEARGPETLSAAHRSVFFGFRSVFRHFALKTQGATFCSSDHTFGGEPTTGGAGRLQSRKKGHNRTWGHLAAGVWSLGGSVVPGGRACGQVAHKWSAKRVHSRGPPAVGNRPAFGQRCPNKWLREKVAKNTQGAGQVAKIPL